MSDNKSWVTTTAFVAVPVLGFFSLLGVALLGGASNANACEPGTTSSFTVDPENVPTEPIAGFGGEQLKNAAIIMTAGQDMNLPDRDLGIAVMVAMGESSLKVLPYGDDAENPDGTPNTSIGLFQQQHWWGTEEERMDAYDSSIIFYEALEEVTGRASMEPTAVGNAVQGNLDPQHYASSWAPAVEVAEALSGGMIALDPADNGECSTTGDTPGDVTPGGWSAPTLGPVTSPYGDRGNLCTPAGCVPDFHTGSDWGSEACGAPIWAIRDGVVTKQYHDSAGGRGVYVDHGEGVEAMYIHMYDSGIFVKPGDQVTAGQHIAETGNTGFSSGCHLHLEIRVDGELVDAAAFLIAMGVELP
ncbi:M23 family metallopeptidase [Agrococcus casei]|uniref:M23 family metallopeptidase n=1 Tax=Agrococcus casei TaxID=343512 RepID=UPI003F91AE4D